MLLYLPGPQGPDQLSTKWLLMERGYAVTCATDVASREYAKEDSSPAPDVFRQRQLYEMLRADAVVLEDEVLDDTATVMRIMHVCRWSGIPVLRYDELPALAPTLAARDAIVQERDLVREEAEPVNTRLKTQLRGALRRFEGWARRFDAAWGWFFTNGNKEQRTPVVYKEIDTKPLTTA